MYTGTFFTRFTVNCRQQLDDIRGDVQILRQRLRYISTTLLPYRARTCTYNRSGGEGVTRPVAVVEENSTVGKHRRQQLLEQLEILQIKHQTLRHDLQVLSKTISG